MKKFFSHFRRISPYRLPLIVLAFAGFFIVGLELANAGRIAHGVKLAGEDWGGITHEEARTKLEDLEKMFPQKTLTAIGRRDDGSLISKNITPSEIGLTFNVEKTLSELFAVGRDENVAVGIGRQLKALGRTYDLPYQLSFDDETFEAFIKTNFSEIDLPAKDATLAFDATKRTFAPTPASKGKIVDREKFKADLIHVLAYNTNTARSIEVSRKEDVPKVTSGGTREAKENALQLIARGPYTLTFEEKTWPVEESDFIDWLDFYPEMKGGGYVLGVRLGNDRVGNYLTQLAPGLNRAPVNAELAVKDGRVATFRLSQNGVSVNVEASIPLIINTIAGGENHVTLAKTIVEPEITTEKIDTLGIRSFLAVGRSNFKGSPKNRIHNIKVGSGRFHGVLIKPGETFSFNTILGTVGPQEGYLAELVIKKDKTVPEYGGGLCQVSTTMFRAAILAGLPIVERFPHSFAVRYYSPQGFDATIYPPHPDLRFTNNTPGHILVQTKVEGNDLAFEFYGTDDGRKVEMEGPVQYDIKSDGSMKAKFTRRITKDGELVEERTFFSVYKSPLLYPVQRNPLE